MKKTQVILLVLVCCFLSGQVFAENDDIKEFPACKYCGMDRMKFAHSRVLIDYDDGTKVGTCSIHCAAVDLAISIDRTPKRILVADFHTRALIDSEKAFWTIGGSKPGVMTKRAKWAFTEMAGAENFIKAGGGTLSGSDQVFRSAYEDMYADTQMIREKRKMMRAKK